MNCYVVPTGLVIGLLRAALPMSGPPGLNVIRNMIRVNCTDSAKNVIQRLFIFAYQLKVMLIPLVLFRSTVQGDGNLVEKRVFCF